MTSSDAPPLRVGILGCASIARKNCLAILSEESDCTVTAVASRSKAKAKAFISKNIPQEHQQDVTAFGGDTAYNDLVQSSGLVDALYIPLPTSMHKKWVILALQSDKHVLVEKPVALTASDYKEMMEVAFKCSKYLQDGTMFVHHDRTTDFLSRVGSAKSIQTTFGFLGNDDFFENDIRIRNDCDALGCIGDVGWYCIRMGLVVFDKVGAGRVVSAQATDYKTTGDGVPIEATCVVRFQEDRILRFHCGFTSPFRQPLEVCGDEYWLTMDDYVLPKAGPNQYQIHKMDLTEGDLISTHSEETIVCPSRSVQEVLMWKSFCRSARSIDDDARYGCEAGGMSDNGWKGDNDAVTEANAMVSTSLRNQQIVDALMESIQKGGSVVDLS